MQTLALELTTTFVDDAIELVKGLGRITVDLATAPIERIARACDVAGVLEQRRANRRAASSQSCNRRTCSPFGGLSELT
ncbi:hypothetical protein IC762_03325 [Bradyrhizobium genosp. L]|uniref:hypothetical protein n=1 Tax=Bradyrhizobium genosp. L TaxID=83637 RepID=UPI0018A2FB09|nr:hypothetical protein [Bradyrhizobium genosp. L]QPF85380.1 hypothetical protein IC762_03325 [Bradyrhizobium genosp. L]